MNLQVGHADRAIVGSAGLTHLLWLLHAGLDWGGSVLLCRSLIIQQAGWACFHGEGSGAKVQAKAHSIFSNLYSSPLGATTSYLIELRTEGRRKRPLDVKSCRVI